MHTQLHTTDTHIPALHARSRHVQLAALLQCETVHDANSAKAQPKTWVRTSGTCPQHPRDAMSHILPSHTQTTHKHTRASIHKHYTRGQANDTSHPVYNLRLRMLNAQNAQHVTHTATTQQTSAPKICKDRGVTHRPHIDHALKRRAHTHNPITPIAITSQRC